MCRMELDNQKNFPTQDNPEENPSDSLNETQPVLSGQEQTMAPQPDQTIATPDSQEPAVEPGSEESSPALDPSKLWNPSDIEETVATPISLEFGSQVGLDETIPPPSDQEGAHDPAGVALPPPPNGEKPGKKVRKPGWRSWTLLGVLALILIAATSAFLGYRSGINQRTSAEASQVAQKVEEQYQMGLQDMDTGRYDVARQRFEYVIQLRPDYPGVTEKLADVILKLNATATPTLVPTPTITPTPDTRNVDELFNQAQQSLANEDWNTTIDTLQALRKADPNYRPVWVDDMLYVSLRNRGTDKILKTADLEGGIYDLSLAERFGPLDADAKSYLTWASLYITGASFWDIDWSQAVYYFAQVAPALPNLRDGSGWTAAERYRLALIGYGGYLADNKDWCNAEDQYRLALSMGQDSKVEETLAFVKDKCSPPAEEKPQPTAESTQPPPAENPPPTEASPTEAPPTQAPPTEAPPTEAPPNPEPSPTPNP
jgi:tetratricopeptide (TPR) repeat protein